MKSFIRKSLFLLILSLAGSGLSGAAPLRADDFGYAQSRPGPDGRIENPAYQPKCHRGYHARGQVIGWAKTEQQCRDRTNGRSWGHSGHYVNIYREGRREVFDR